MTLTPFFRKLSFTSHITFSVGWFGAVVGFLALAICGVISQNGQIVRAAYIAMELISWYVIVPSCLASLLTGLIQSICTPWGLFRHYWVITKLILTVVATILLLLHIQPISYLGTVALQHELAENELDDLRIQLIADAGAALLVLLTAITLSVYKPWGRTSSDIPKEVNRNSGKLNLRRSKKSKWIKHILVGSIILVILMFILLHFVTGGPKHH